MATEKGVPEAKVVQNRQFITTAPPAGPGRARPPNVFWYILGIILHVFE